MDLCHKVDSESDKLSESFVPVEELEDSRE
jgi:hypothetical protein